MNTVNRVAGTLATSLMRVVGVLSGAAAILCAAVGVADLLAPVAPGLVRPAGRPGVLFLAAVALLSAMALLAFVDAKLSMRGAE